MAIRGTPGARGGPHGQQTNKKIQGNRLGGAGGAGGGGPRPTVGILWPRGNRGK